MPPVPNAERQRAFRERLKKEGKVALRLAILPTVVEQLDSLRDGDASREDIVERLIQAEVRRKRR